MMTQTYDYTTVNGEDMVRFDAELGVFETFRGTHHSLYLGTDAAAAAASLEMSDQEFHQLLMSDPD